MQVTEDVFSIPHIGRPRSESMGRMNYEDNLIAILFQAVKNPIAIIWVVW